MKNRKKNRKLPKGRSVSHPSMLDPTRTGALRKRFTAQLKRQFNSLKGIILKFVGDGDAFGLNDRVTANANPEGCNQYTGPGCGSITAGYTSADGSRTDIPDSNSVNRIVAARDRAVFLMQSKGIDVTGMNDIKIVTTDPGKGGAYATGTGFTHRHDDQTEEGFEKVYASVIDSRKVGEVPTYAFQSLEDRMIHEIGHNIGRRLSPEDRKELERLHTKYSDNTDHLPSYYAQENSSELWAESVLAVVKDYKFGGTAKQHGPQNPELENFVRSRLSKKPTTNILRENMPQIRKEHWDKFLTYLRNDYGGYSREESINPSLLKAVQEEFSQDRVNAIPMEKLKYPILISRDGYVLDGNHRWIKAYQTDTPLTVLRLKLDVDDALEAMRDFPQAEFVGNVFCPTGEGGGIDNSCRPSEKIQRELDRVSSSFSSAPLSDHEDKMVYEWKTGNSNLLDKPDFIAAVEKGVVEKDITIYRAGNLSSTKALEFTTREGWARDTAEAQDRSVIVIHLKKGDRALFVPLATKHHIVEVGVLLPPSTMKKYENLTTNASEYRFDADPEKLRKFQEWLKKQLASLIVGKTQEQLWDVFVQEGYKRGAGRAFDDVNVAKRALAGAGAKLDFYKGTKEEFLKSAFGRPVSVDKVKLLASRSFDELEDVSREMSNKISRVLVDGLVTGKGPRQIARDMTKQVDLSLTRATVIARTEIVRAHAEGQLEAFKNLGVESVGAAVEWSTAEDERVCELCEPLEGIVLKVDEARNMLPRHPNCRCAWIPAGVGEESDDQKDDKKSIDRAIRMSQKREGQDDDDEDSWGSNKPIGKDRPESILNAFCPTGEGGGIDNSCGSEGDGGGSTQFSIEHEVRDNGFHKFKVKDGDKEIGFLTVRAWPALGEVNVKQIEVSADYRRKGLASKLHEMAQNYAKSQGLTYTSDAGLMRSPAAEGYWKKMVASGKAKNVGGRYEIISGPVGNDDLSQFESLLGNAFCPTGEGGGIDNSCSPDQFTSGPSRLVGDKGETIRVDGGRIDIQHVTGKFSPRKQSVIDFVVEEDRRGKGIGDKLLKEALRRYDDLGGQVSSAASLKVFFNNGFRNPDLKGGQATFSEHLALFKEDGGSLYMTHKDDNGRAFTTNMDSLFQFESLLHEMTRNANPEGCNQYTGPGPY